MAMIVATVRAVAMIVYNDAKRDPFECFLATPPRPPAGGPRDSIFLNLDSACSLLLKLLLIIVTEFKY